MAVHRAMASCDVVGSTPSSTRRTSHAVKTVTSWGGDGWCGAMAGVEAPSVGNMVSSCCGHKEVHTSVVLGGNANVICVGAMWGPTRADGEIIINKAFHTEGRNGCLVVVQTIDLLVGGPGGIPARETKEIER